MFTGLIQKTGSLTRVERSGGSGSLSVRAAAWEQPLQAGESLAVQGVCLTLTGEPAEELRFDVLEETFLRTNLGCKQPGDLLNLERALRYGDALGGHIVSGHVDGVGTVTGLRKVGERDWELRMACAAEHLQEMVPKGSVCCDGVSLTLVDVDTESFTVHLIPHTWSRTSFHRLREGDAVNLETDVLAKYMRSILRHGGKPEVLNWETLRKLGAD